RAGERAEERRHEPTQEVFLGAGVVDEVLRQTSGAVVVVTQLLVEVVDDRRVSPPRDRDQEVVEQTERSNSSSGADERPHEWNQLVAAEEHRASEEIRPNGNEVVLERQAHGRAVGETVQP